MSLTINPGSAGWDRPVSLPEQHPAQPAAGPSFAQILEGAGKVIDGGAGLHGDILAFEQRIRGGESLSTGDLILYQIKAGRFGLGVELVSRMAEGVMSTIRKFQQGQ